jgi:hypothetical protein
MSIIISIFSQLLSDNLPERLVRIEVITALVNIGQLYGFFYPVGRYGDNILVEKAPITVI